DGAGEEPIAEAGEHVVIIAVRVAQVARADHQVIALADLGDHLRNELGVAIAIRAERQDDVARELRQGVEIGEADPRPALDEDLIAVRAAPFEGAVGRAAVNDDELIVPFRPDARKDGLDPLHLVQGEGDERDFHHLDRGKNGRAHHSDAPGDGHDITGHVLPPPRASDSVRFSSKLDRDGFYVERMHHNYYRAIIISRHHALRDDPGL